MEKKENTKSSGINVLDLFSGIGGFSLGLEQSGQQINWHGFSDIDKYANELFKRRFPNAKELGSVVDVSYKSIGKKINLLTGGFPCQSFSIAGSRGGFSDTRGTLFFEIERILRDFIENKSPIPLFLLENVKGLLNHDNGRTFATVYRVLSNLGYTVECQLVNTRWFLPQNRERIFIFGRYNGNPGGQKVFPIRQNEEKTKNNGQEINISNASPREFGWKDISPALCARDYKDPKLVKVADFRNDEGLRIRKDLISPCLSNRRHSEKDISTMPPIVMHSTQPRSGNPKQGGTGPLSKDDGTTYCLDTGNTQAVEYNESSIRRLTPIECERLQGFPDNWTDGQSNTQRYKQLGNAVSVPVIKSIMERIFNGL